MANIFLVSTSVIPKSLIAFLVSSKSLESLMLSTYKKGIYIHFEVRGGNIPSSPSIYLDSFSLPQIVVSARGPLKTKINKKITITRQQKLIEDVVVSLLWYQVHSHHYKRES